MSNGADILICSTGSPGVILTKSDGQRLIQLRKNRPVFIIDIAVPRDVDPELNRLDNIFLYNIDDLQHVVDANLKHRRKEAQFAETIIQEEVQSYIKQNSRTRCGSGHRLAAGALGWHPERGTGQKPQEVGDSE